MKLTDVIEIINGLRKAGVTVRIDSGWCFDALVGRELCEHNEITSMHCIGGEQDDCS